MAYANLFLLSFEENEACAPTGPLSALCSDSCLWHAQFLVKGYLTLLLYIMFLLQERKMIDRFRLAAKGGDGGNGCYSYRRSRHNRRGTPDGEFFLIIGR